MNLKGEPAYVGRFCGTNTYDVTDTVVDFYEDALDDATKRPAGIAPPSCTTASATTSSASGT